MIQSIMLPNGRWKLRFQESDGPTALYEGPAFWPSAEMPELVAITDYYGSANVWRIHSVVNQTDVEWLDHTL